MNLSAFHVLSEETFSWFCFSGIDGHDAFQYDFTKLDQLLDRLDEMRLYPVIEFMGNPSNRFFNQKHFSQTYLWRDLVYQMLSRYISKYWELSILK